MIISFKSFLNKKDDPVKCTETSRKHTQSWNRGIDRKKQNFVPESDNKKRAHHIIKKFERNLNLKKEPIPTEQLANEIARCFGIVISNKNGNFSNSLGRTGLKLVRYNSKYIVIRK